MCGSLPNHEPDRKRVTSAWLAKQRACDAGRKWFDYKFPENGLFDGALPEHVLALCNNPGWIRWFLKRWPAEDLV